MFPRRQRERTPLQRGATSRSASPVRAAAWTRVLVDAGSWVNQGQVLAAVDRSVQAQQAAQLSAQVDAARADAALAQNNYERALALKDTGLRLQGRN